MHAISAVVSLMRPRHCTGVGAHGLASAFQADNGGHTLKYLFTVRGVSCNTKTYMHVPASLMGTRLDVGVATTLDSSVRLHAGI